MLQFACVSLAAFAVFSAGGLTQAATVKILNVSYDVTREFYQEVDTAFAASWKAKTGDDVIVSQSHDGAGKQAQAVIAGLEADVVTLNQPADIDLLFSSARLLPKNWAARLPNHSVPCCSTVVFVVRKGNPKQIKDWDDLVRPEVSVVVPNPKTSGTGRYAYLAAWGYALKKTAGPSRDGVGSLLANGQEHGANRQVQSPGYGPAEAGDAKQARKFVGKLFAHVPVLDTGARGASITFAGHGIGDVLLAFESEAAQLQTNFPDEAFEVVVPPISILAENPVAWLDRNVERHHTEAVARAYLEFLYSDEGQELAAKYHFRPKNQAILARCAGRFPALELFTVADIAGGWQQAQQRHFSDGGIFDQIHQTNN
jgi:sulfate transport system substrate-binding protein